MFVRQYGPLLMHFQLFHSKALDKNDHLFIAKKQFHRNYKNVPFLRLKAILSKARNRYLFHTKESSYQKCEKGALFAA